ncbi:MAG: aminoacyl-tRNA hydrolase [Chloroflexi bacterium]|nr:aminoacyl-tRNA hydrolase [Chloroflexota bacterium]
MSDQETLWVRPGLEIPLSELRFRFSRSAGPGGQHVNRSETQVELLWDVAHSPSLSEGQRERLLQQLASRIDSEGMLHLVSSATRSQFSNRLDVMQRLVRLLQSALQPQRRRVPTRPSAGGVQRRLEGKRRRSVVKRQRSRSAWEDD